MKKVGIIAIIVKDKSIVMEVQKAYEIFTDASFDDVAKVGTYAIVIMQEKKILKMKGVQSLKIKNKPRTLCISSMQHYHTENNSRGFILIA